MEFRGSSEYIIYVHVQFGSDVVSNWTLEKNSNIEDRFVDVFPGNLRPRTLH